MKINLVILFCLLSLICPSQNWEPVGTNQSGTNGRCELFKFKDKLFIAGEFSLVDEKSASGLAYWNDINWIPFNISSVIHSVSNFATFKGELYAFVVYTNSFPRLIKYEESTNTWKEVPNSLVKHFSTSNGSQVEYGYIYDALEFEGELYVVGDFDMIGGEPFKNIAKWDGTDWRPLLENTPDKFNSEYISILTIFKKELIFHGLIVGANGHTFNNVVKWDGTQFDNLSGGLIDRTNSFSEYRNFETYNNELYISGSRFAKPGDNNSHYLFKWDGHQWKGIKDFEVRDSWFYDYVITALGRYGNNLILGQGDGGRTLIYNGTKIKPLDYSLSDYISNFEVFNNMLYASGPFRRTYGPQYVAKLSQLSTSPSNETDSLLIFPNPSSGSFFVEYKLNENSKTAINISNMPGKTIIQKSFNDTKGRHIRNFNLTNFPKGTYVVRISTKEFTRTKLIISN